MPFKILLVENVKGIGWHLANSYIALGSGGLKGLGLGQGIQKLGYLPESHTDFIMAVIAEELRCIWCMFCVVMFRVYCFKRNLYWSKM